MYSIVNRGPRGFNKTLESYSLGKMVSPSLHRTENSLQTSPCFRCSFRPFFLWKLHDTPNFRHPQAGMLKQPQLASQKSEDSWAWLCRIYTHRRPFSKPTLFLFKQWAHVWCSVFPFANAPAEHLHSYHGNYQVACLVPEAETASKKANTVVYCFFLD